MTTSQQKDHKAFLALNRLGIKGRREALKLFEEGKAPQEVLLMLQGGGQNCRNGFDPDRELSLCHEKKINLMTILDPAYPVRLKEIPDPPLLLYGKGKFLEGDESAVAVVGSRHPSFYGRTQAKRFSGELTEKGLTIVSGLARGIDQIAHEAALDVPYGRTLAVLGSGLDVIYPKENEKLYHRILERGVILSEYALGTPPLAENFPRRNRILSGLSLGVFVVEAHSRSGSLITAHQALDQGREVFALPGPVDQLTSRGTHQLLKEGAALVESPEDILETLALSLGKKEGCRVVPAKEHPASFALELTESDSTKVLLEVLGEEGPLAQDEILDITGLEPSELPGLLLKLELEGKARRASDGKYSLC